MHDDDLREGFDTLLSPIREAAPPPMQVIRRRLRRRRVRTVAASTAALAAMAATVLSVHLTAGPRPPTASPATTPTPTGFTAPRSVPPSGSPIPGVRRTAVTYQVLSPVNSLALSADVSLVTITGSQQRTVSVTEQIQYSQTPPSFSRSVSGGVLSLGYTCPAERDCGVSYQIQVPRDTAVSVTLQTGFDHAVRARRAGHREHRDRCDLRHRPQRRPGQAAHRHRRDHRRLHLAADRPAGHRPGRRDQHRRAGHGALQRHRERLQLRRQRQHQWVVPVCDHGPGRHWRHNDRPGRPGHVAFGRHARRRQRLLHRPPVRHAQSLGTGTDNLEAPESVAMESGFAVYRPAVAR